MKEKACKLLMISQGLLWMYMTIQSAVSGAATVLILLMMALDGVFYILLAFADIRKLFFKLAVPGFLGVNTLLTITDQMGFYDFLVLVWNIILLVLAFFMIFKQAKKQ